MFDLTGRVALITGATGGIGGAIAKKLKQAGATVVVSGRNIAKMDAEFDDEYIKIPCDLATDGGAVELIMETIERAGKIDILINNAGVASQGLFTDISDLEWNEVLDVNLNGVFNVTQAVLPYMIRQKSGSIINISSMWGQVGASCEVAYSAAKAGVIGLTKALAKEVGPSGVRVNCIAPGLIETGMNQELTLEDVAAIVEETPLGRIGSTNDVASSALFLASDESSFVTGQVLGVNGGYII